jgi:hypothetical protein
VVVESLLGFLSWPSLFPAFRAACCSRLSLLVLSYLQSLQSYTSHTQTNKCVSDLYSTSMDNLAYKIGHCLTLRKRRNSSASSPAVRGGCVGRGSPDLAPASSRACQVCHPTQTAKKRTHSVFFSFGLLHCGELCLVFGCCVNKVSQALHLQQHFCILVAVRQGFTLELHIAAPAQ